MTTLQAVELGVLGPLQVRQNGAPVAVPGAKPRAILTMLGLHHGSVVSADTLIELLWGEEPPRTAAKALQTHISSLRRALGDGFVLTAGAGWTLAESDVDASRYKSAARLGRDAAAAGDNSQAVARFEEALALWRGVPELPDGRRGTSEKTRWIEGHAALVEDRLDALLATGRAAEVVGDLEAAVADAPLRERRWGQLMLALYRAGRQGEALSAYQRARSLLADELGVDPGPELRRLEAAIVAQDASLDIPVAQNLPAVTRAVTFLLTDIEGSTAAWEADADAMGVALARHDELVEQVVTSRGGRLIKTRGEGDATFSVFERPSAAAAAAIELQDAMVHEPWALLEPMRIRVALHTGEAELRDGDYFGRAVNRAARLRSLAEGGQILCSGATAELVIDSLSDDVVLNDLGMRQLKNLARPEHVFELRLEAADEHVAPASPDEPIERPVLPAVLAGPGPFVGRGRELARLFSAWQTTLAGGTNAVLIAGEPGVGKTRLSGEWSRQAYDQGALVIYGRCDEDLGAPYQPFAEALRSLVPCLGALRLRGMRGVEALLALVPGLTDVLPDLAAPTRADPDTERFALFDAVVALLGLASAGAPVVLILDDLHWAAKPTLLLLRHLLRFGDQARVQIVGTYRSTDLDRSHPLAAMLADLHRDGTASRIALSGLNEEDVTAYVAEVGYDDEELARALASVTGGNPFFLIEALRHVEESGGHWDPSTLPQGVREAVTRRLSRLTPETNKALGAAAVVGSRFGLELVERVVGDDLVDAFDEACKAGIVIEESGGNYRFNHALVRQSLLAELASVRRMRLHQRIATTLETQPGADDELLAELAYHYFECAWAGNAAKAVDYCRRAADQAMARLGYEGAADLYDRALHALEEIDEELPDRDDQATELMVARCEALLAAGDVTTAAGAVSQLQRATSDSARLAAWATCFDGELSMLINPERLDEIEAALGAAAAKLAELGDAAGEAKAHTVRASCLARLGRVGDCEVALDDALTAARRAGEHRRVNAVLAGAPLAALWGPNPVPRAGGRCLDVVRLLRITTDSPAVEATSTRCQAVLEAFRGRAEAARRMIDSARRTVTELGLRHALLEVEQFAGIVELVADDPVAAEPHLRQAYNGFRRMGLDADTAETAALLGRACLTLDQEAEADELCTESERLAGHALKPAMAWRMLRAQLLSRRGDHDAAREQAEAAVALAERTDALVDHGDACLALATVLSTAGNVDAARAAAERAVDLYERKGAAALAEKARHVLGERPILPVPAKPPSVEVDNACVRAGHQLVAAVNREAWDEVEQLFASTMVVESRRKIVGFGPVEFPSHKWPREMRSYLELGIVRHVIDVIAVRGDRLALVRLELGTGDLSPGAPQDEALVVGGLDENGRIALQVWFDVDDLDAAVAEIDATHARFEGQARLEGRKLANAASQMGYRFVDLFAAGDWDTMAEILADDFSNDDRRRQVGNGVTDGRDAQVATMRVIADVFSTNVTADIVATRGRNLALGRITFSVRDEAPDAFLAEVHSIVEINADEKIATIVLFDVDDFDAAIAELDARYLAGEAAAHAHTWSVIVRGFESLAKREIPAITPNWVAFDHRRGINVAPGNLTAYVREVWDEESVSSFIETVHRLNHLGAIFVQVAKGTSREGFDAERRVVDLLTVEGDLIDRTELFDEADLDAAIAKFEQLSRPTPWLETAATRLYERFKGCFAARDWDTIAEMLSDNVRSEDRRRVVNSGLRHGRDALIAELSAIAELPIDLTSDVVATRGAHLVLSRVESSGQGQGPDPFSVAGFDVIELDADERVVARILFDLEDFEAAVAELDARYLAGEAAACAHTWTVITSEFAALNRRELPATTTDWVNIDHRRGASFATGEMFELLGAAWHRASDLSNFIEAVHRLNDFGGVITHMARETSQEGFHAEWRVHSVFTLQGDMISRCEVFDGADLDAAIAKFDQLSRPAPRLENAASRAYGRFRRYFAARDWAAMAELLTADTSVDDHRRVVNAQIRRGRDVEIANMQAFADIGATKSTATVIATRGERLVLCRTCISGEDDQPGAFHIEFLNIAEVTADERIAARSAFDVDDFDAAVAELDARYAVGEAAPHARTWSTITRGNAAANRRETLPITPDCITIDHRLRATLGADDQNAYVRASWELTPDFHILIESVHRLSDLGVVVTHASRGTSQNGFDAEWRQITLLTVEGDLGNHCEIFDEADLDLALARFEELSKPARRLENTASRVCQRFESYLVAGDWGAAAEMLAAKIAQDDRRRLVGGGLRQGRDAIMAEISLVARELKSRTTDIMAVRGRHLVLNRVRSSFRDELPDAFGIDILDVIEIDSDERVLARVVFDFEEFDAAIAELDARYLAGEAAPYSHTWSLIIAGYAMLNRCELPTTTTDFVSFDHRRAAAFAPGELIEYLRAGWNLGYDAKAYVEVVHRLSDLGAVVSHRAYGTSPEGFEAEWRTVTMSTFEGDLANRTEIFDEADLDTAITKFEQLSRPTRRLENTSSRVAERFLASFAAGDWDAMANVLADNVCNEDRRRVVGGEVRHGRDAQIADMRATAELWTTSVTQTVLATRGKNLNLMRNGFSSRDDAPEKFVSEVYTVGEIDADERIVSIITFDLDDFDAAIAELDRRYLAGEAAAHAHTWSVIVRAYWSLIRHELPPTTPDWVNIDHRRGVAFAPGDMTAYLRDMLDSEQSTGNHIEVVHRLDNLGALFIQVLKGTSQEGFDAEWRLVTLMTVDGDVINRAELFDEGDLDVAIAKFEELGRPTPRLENAASQVVDDFQAYYAAGDWQAMAEVLVEDYSSDDRRRVVGSGVRHGRDAHLADMRARAELWLTNRTSNVMATRGERLALFRIGMSDPDRGPEAFVTELLIVEEINADGRLAAGVAFDLDDFDSAIAELDARYLAGEAAAHAHTWSVIVRAYLSLIRHELPPTTPDWVNLDHRRGVAFAPGDLTAYIRARWDTEQGLTTYIETVHRLNNLGAVFTQALKATSPEGFDAEWRVVELITVDGDLINRAELFDEADLDTALARFDELSQPRRLDNIASRVAERFQRHFTAGDWAALAETFAEDFSNDDRRRVVGAGVRHGRDAEMADLRSIAEVGITKVSSTPVATRGERLVLTRGRLSSGDQGADAYFTESLAVVEIDTAARIVALVNFDLEHIEAAFEELDSRYLAGEAAAHSHTWSLILGAYLAINQRELFATTEDFENVDHRRGAAFAPGDLIEYLRAGWDLDHDIYLHIETVHRLSDRGALLTHNGYGTSREGFHAEWREVMIFTTDGDLFSRVEVFDDADLDAALARFEELHIEARRLDNAAIRVAERFWAHYAAADWDAVAETVADDFHQDDRRRVVGAGVRHGRDEEIVDLRAIAGLWTEKPTATYIATRGQRLALMRLQFSLSDQGPEAFVLEVLGICEINADERIVASIEFDPEDLDAAFAELDARYLAGDAAPHAEAWSVITHAYAALNRRELPPAKPDWVNIDHRRGTTVAPGDVTAFIRAAWDLERDHRNRIETVHRVNRFGAVITRVSSGTSQEGFEAEWRSIDLLTVEGDLINRLEIFDEAGLDAALTRFAELDRPAQLLDNAATQIWARLAEAFNRRDLGAYLAVSTADIRYEDRRKGLRDEFEGPAEQRKSVLAMFGATPDSVQLTAESIAVRGSRLSLMHVCYRDTEYADRPITVEMMQIVEVSTSGLLQYSVSFDPDDIDAAFEELDGRYLADEAAAHAHTWSVITSGYSATNRHELPGMTPDSVYIDHRACLTTEREDLAAYLPSVWDLTPDISSRIEAVHRLTDEGAVVTHAACGTTQHGLDAEWRAIVIGMVEGDLYSRVEVFDEADLDAAIARFDELHSQPRQLENAASRVFERYLAHYVARNWDVVSEILSDDVYNHDRRRVVNAGVLHGRDATMASMQATAALGLSTITPIVIATRGERLSLTRERWLVGDQQSGAFSAEVLGIIEIDADERIVARIPFDPEDTDAAFAELDARYLAGEAAAHAPTWSVIAQTYAAFNRHEFPSTTSDSVYVDHRRLLTNDASELTANIRATWELMDGCIYIAESVHRLSEFGAVVTQTLTGTPKDGLDVEYRMIDIFMVKDGLLSLCEVFDEADIDAALARFEELQPPTPRLENAASAKHARLTACVATRDWDGLSEILADDIAIDDRRRVVNSGITHGRDAAVANMGAVIDVGLTNVSSTVIATRGDRLDLCRTCISGQDRPQAFQVEFLSLVEIDADERIVARVLFDPEDLGAAVEELNARYLAGEAAAHSHTWSVVTQAYAALNRGELPPVKADWVNLDHRRGIAFAPGEMAAYVIAGSDLTPDTRIYIETVHRLSSLGAVVTQVLTGTSQDGFDAEWREIGILTFEGDLISRAELFDEEDLDAALARFDELQPQPSRPENAAVRADERFFAHTRARNWAAAAEILAENTFVDDRRRVVNIGVWEGRDIVIANLQALAEAVAGVTSTAIAIRGERLALTRISAPNRDLQQGDFGVEMLGIVELDAVDRVTAHVMFDPDDIDAAFAELDARYMAGEAAPCARTWSAMARTCAVFNQGELPATTPNSVYVDHRPVLTVDAVDLPSYLRAMWDVTPDIRVEITAVHRLSALGAVVTHTLNETSPEGFNAEWRGILIYTLEADMVNRCEVFDETDLDAALARFDELDRRASS